MSDSANALLSIAHHAAEQRTCGNLLRDYEIKREQKIIEHNNAGCFYRFVINKLSCKRGPGALGDCKGRIILSDAKRADLLNDFSGSVFAADNGTMPAVERL
jgi:hypothetical protein